MKSAYLVLGIPGNASKEEVEEAYATAADHYSKSKLATEPQAIEKFLEVKNAYHVLRDDESRAAHDRKLNAMQSQPAGTAATGRTVRVLQEEPETAWFARPLPILAIVVVAVFATGFYFNAKRETARKELAAQELRLKELAAKEAEKEELRLAKEEAERVREARQAEWQDERFRRESSQALANARAAEIQRSYQETQRLNSEQREAQRKDYEARSHQQNIAREAQQRLASDKSRIRELCYQNYRRYDC